ncbi:YybH family protein [Flagellimonas flava]|uniref:DUF4440 domain-containing protein n=1 Tax=Flagellimonas flava TaxID=570519 RepID=A0A1M5KJT9_9FLAO|nr:nuclear transport factor 2 family protein [Allomuricauda flava]SHG52995.1 conserved hypothetical protein [Allomuricauda flava]
MYPTQKSIRLLVLFFMGLLAIQCAPKKEEAPLIIDQSLTETDIVAIKAARKNYTNAWLAGDSTQIMAALTPDVVLIPHHGDMPIEGPAAIKEFWWPADALPSKVTQFTSTTDEVDGQGNIAYVRGRFTLVFTYGEQTFSNTGNYLNVLKKNENSEWKLARLIWNDPIATTDTN